MTKKLYKMMNWARIEGIVYSEEDMPQELLGAHTTSQGVLVQFFYPNAIEATYISENVTKSMELVDEAGYFALLLPKTATKKYYVEVLLENNQKKLIDCPYNYKGMISEKDVEKFQNGVHYEIYKYLGAHVVENNGVTGVHFAVWAPNAIRVSVVGDFNGWDGRANQMCRIYNSGIFELFIPDASADDLYKFEIKIKGGLTMLKADPYGVQAQLRPETASVVCDLSEFTFDDDAYLKNRKSIDKKDAPMSVYELHLGSFNRKDGEDMPFLNYRELADEIVPYVKEMGYTHVELMPIMEHPFDASWGYQVIGYYAPTSRYGTPTDFKYFINKMHQNNIGVILDWVPAHFPKDSHGLAFFDGTCLYEHEDKRKGEHPHWGTLIYNYGRKEVANYLIANALYWVEEFHADGLRLDAVASMLYLDYGRQDGEWIPNIYGGKENLEALEFLKHLNSIMRKRNPDVYMIAEESTAWPKVTGALEDDGLGFDLKWNMGWMNDFTNYIKLDPFFRSASHGELTFSMIYAYSENFMLVLSHDEVVHGKASMLNKMPGSITDKFNNLKASYGYMFAHPGKKLLFMGQDIGVFDEWSEELPVPFDLLEHESHKGLQKYVKQLNELYQTKKCLYELDGDGMGFEWINNISANENVIVFLRKAKDTNDFLLVVCNFANEARENYKVGVPFAGKYTEILNSDQKEFHGTGLVNEKPIWSDESECDDKENSIQFKMPPLSTQFFAFEPFTKAEEEEIAIRKEEERKALLERQKQAEANQAITLAKQAASDAMLEAKNARLRANEIMKRAKKEEEYAQKLLKNADMLAEKVKKLEEAEALRMKAASEQVGVDKATAPTANKATTARKTSASKTGAAKKTTATKKEAATIAKKTTTATKTATKKATKSASAAKTTATKSAADKTDSADK